jgi:hypothetical protein
LAGSAIAMIAADGTEWQANQAGRRGAPCENKMPGRLKFPKSKKGVSRATRSLTICPGDPRNDGDHRNPANDQNGLRMIHVGRAGYKEIFAHTKRAMNQVKKRMCKATV